MMTLEQLVGRYFRLKQELAHAYAQKLWHRALIDRIAADISATERQIASRQDARPSAEPLPLA